MTLLLFYCSKTLLLESVRSSRCTFTCLVGVETVVRDGADEVQVGSLHVSDPSGGLLESCETHVEVDLIQVATVEGV